LATCSSPDAESAKVTDTFGFPIGTRRSVVRRARAAETPETLKEEMGAPVSE
jgi:hypothetical protein